MSTGPAVLYTAGFLLYGLMEVLGILPQEIKSAGFTLPALFSRYYGDQNLNFISYEVKRTTATLLLHTNLPLIYCIGLHLVTPDLHTNTQSVHLLWLVALSLSLTGVGVAFFWYGGKNKWHRHPLFNKLSRFGQPVRAVVSSVNLEFRDIDKFVSSLGGSTVVVTDSWILQCNVHSVDLLHQRDAVLNVSTADAHRLSLEGHSVQYLSIKVDSINTKFKSFSIRLNSLQYGQLRDKLLAPIRTARNVVIHQSLSDRFTAAFTEQVEMNGTYELPPGSPTLEPCIGCMQNMPQVKLQKCCTDIEEGLCRPCFCRPLWCVSCMSKWFAARQDQYRPDTWMTSTAPCPMCRATFCVLDVLKFEGNTNV